ncbi:acetylserotonin O-methyltransferase-like [Salvelinus alpinus]
MEPAGTTAAAAAYPRKILDYMEGFLVSKTLFTACELGVFDLLASSQHPLSLEEVALGIRASQDGTERLLAACTGLDLLNTHTLDGQVMYSNTEQSSVYLTQSSPVSLTQSIHYSSKTIYLCWHYLTDAVREGSNQYEKAFGVKSEHLFEALYRSEEEMVKFMQLMNSIWNICGRDVVTAFNLSPFTTIYDLGGSWARLKSVCVCLCVCVCVGGGVLVVEALLCEDGSGPLTAQLYSLNMLVQTEGKERTAAEYTALLTAAGFQNIQVERTGKIYDAVLGRK